MVGHDEKQRLLHDFHREPAWGLAEVFKCAVYLLILVGLCVIGIKFDLHWEAPYGAPAEGGPAHLQERASVVRSEKASEEGRASFGEPATAPQSQAVREVPQR